MSIVSRLRDNDGFIIFAMKRFSLSRNMRLRSNRQFKAVLARRCRRRDPLLTLYMAENKCGYPRLGVSVSKAHGNAVVRNRLKRLVREAFRQNQDMIPTGYDYVVMISPAWSKKSKTGTKAKLPTFENIRTSFLALVAAARQKGNPNI